MIKSFKNKQTELFYQGKTVKQWSSIRRQAERRLQKIDMAVSLRDLKHLPSNRFKALQGNRKDQYSIRINKQWRICFCWKDNEAYDVEIVDYH